MNSLLGFGSPLPTPVRSHRVLIDQTSVEFVAVRSLVLLTLRGFGIENLVVIVVCEWRDLFPRMKDKMKDFGKMIQEQKPNGTDVKCAEIKPIPTGLSEKPRFKIGEYNRATASFEMNSTEDLRQKEMKLKFDFSYDGGCHYFKSSFARSMVVNNSHRSKSLDYTFLNRNGYAVKEESPMRTDPENGNSGRNGFEDRYWIPGKENWDLRRAQPAEVRDDESATGSLISEQPSSLKKSKVIEEHLRNQSYLVDRPGSSVGSGQQRCFPSGGERRQDDVLLRSPLSASCRSSFHRSSSSSASDVDSVMLQSQVTTLQWQLRQAEASRQMYRAVMEQVVSFLQKTHRDLDLLQSRLDDDIENVTRVPRSKSVHAVDISPTRVTSSRSEGTLSFQKAKSYAQIGGDPDCPKHGAMYREASWRKTRKQQHDSEEIIPSKLSEEAFRLLRTVKSLLGTREPDLASRLSATCSSPANVADVSSASSTVSATLDSDNSDHFQSQVTLRRAKDTPPQLNGAKDSRRSKGEPEAKGSPPQLSISSADDESGFSSLNSFQEIGLPVTNSTFVHRGAREESKIKIQDSYPDVGLPKVEDAGCKIHRRWSSTPADSHLPKLRPPSLCTNGDVIKVLWV